MSHRTTAFSQLVVRTPEKSSHWIVVPMNKFLALIIFPLDSISLSRLHTTFQEPDIRINDAALRSWEHNQLANAEANIVDRSNPRVSELKSCTLPRAVVDLRQVHLDSSLRH